MNNSIFYRVRCFVENFFRGIKYRRQRARRGYSDRDLWDINYYLAEIIPPMMRHLKENGSGTPTRLKSREEWEEILEDIAKGFDKYIEKDEDPKEALRLLSEYFGCFWS